MDNNNLCDSNSNNCNSNFLSQLCSGNCSFIIIIIAIIFLIFFCSGNTKNEC